MCFIVKGCLTNVDSEFLNLLSKRFHAHAGISRCPGIRLQRLDADASAVGYVVQGVELFAHAQGKRCHAGDGPRHRTCKTEKRAGRCLNAAQRQLSNLNVLERAEIRRRLFASIAH